jgi:hypothetical protein
MKSNLKINTAFLIILILIFSSPFVLNREKTGSERERIMMNKAKLPDDFLVRCEVGDVGVLLQYDTGIASMEGGPGFEYPKLSGNHYLYTGYFWYKYKNSDGDIKSIPSGNLHYISDCAGVSGIIIASRTDTDAHDWAVSALDTRSDWYDKWDNYHNHNGTDIWGTVITHAWSEDYRGDFIFWEITLKNMSTELIRDLYFGQRMNCDVSSKGRGNGAQAFWRDDMVGFYSGTDEFLKTEDNKVYLSYMYDGDNPNIPGDDTGGWHTPKESKAFIGTITVSSPPTTDRYFKENQPSTHQWWDYPEPSGHQQIYRYLSWGHDHPDNPYENPSYYPHDYVYLTAWGPYDIQSNESITIRLATGCGYAPQEYFDNPEHPLDIGIQGLKRNLVWAKKLYQDDWIGPEATTPPALTYTLQENAVLLEWEKPSDTVLDPLPSDLEGYRLYKSTDNVRWELLLQCDLVNDIGRNTGLTYLYTDYSVVTGYNYFYALTAYDRSNPDLGVESMESSKTDNRIQVSTIHGTQNDISRISVAPNPYYASAPWNWAPSSRSPSEDKIGFFGLPEWANIYIYNLSGDHIDKIEHRDPNSGVAYWDGLSKKMYSVVSGVYIYVVEDKNGNKVRGKFVFVR